MHANMKSNHHRSRRDFLHTAALASGAAAIGVTSRAGAQNKARPPKLDRKMGIALVGLGYYSTDLLAPALQETENAYLAGIVTGTPAKAEAWMAQYDIPPENVYDYETFDALASNEAIDIVYVVLPNSMHAEYSIRASRAGKHVICEKPMAMNAAECEAMIAAAEEAGRKLSIGYRMQFEPTTQEIIRLGQERALGPIAMITAGAGYRERRADHWKLSRAMGGGAMMDMGVYSLQAARYVTGEEPVSVSAQTFVSRPELFTEVEETATFQLRFPSGAVANLHTSFGVGMNYLNVNALDGWIKVDPFSAYRGIRAMTSQGELSFPVINQQAAQMDEDAYRMATGEDVRVPGEEGLRDMRVVDAIYASARDGGRTIRLTES